MCRIPFGKELYCPTGSFEGDVILSDNKCSFIYYAVMKSEWVCSWEWITAMGSDSHSSVYGISKTKEALHNAVSLWLFSLMGTWYAKQILCSYIKLLTETLKWHFYR